MVEIKYGITTDLPVGKGSKFSLLNETFHSINLDYLDKIIPKGDTAS